MKIKIIKATDLRKKNFVSTADLKKKEKKIREFSHKIIKLYQ